MIFRFNKIKLVNIQEDTVYFLSFIFIQTEIKEAYSCGFKVVKPYKEQH